MERSFPIPDAAIKIQSGLPNIELRLEAISPITKHKNSFRSPSTRSTNKLSFNDIIDRVSRSHPSKKNSVSHIPSSSRSFIIEELGGLQGQIKEINSKLSENISLLKKKQEKTKELKNTIKKLEQKTLPTDASYEEVSPKWACTQNCLLF